MAYRIFTRKVFWNISKCYQLPDPMYGFAPLSSIFSLRYENWNCGIAEKLSMTTHSQSVPRKRTVVNCVRYIRSVLEERGISEADVSARLIVAHALGVQTLKPLRKHQDVTEIQWTTMEDMTMKRLTHMPIQYALGEWEFRDLTLKMEPPVFIPRPETEQLVEHILESGLSSARSFLEIGTGSGAISISLLKENPALRCIAFESGTSAYNLTKCNAETHGVAGRLCINHMALASSTLHQVQRSIEAKVDFVVSNPPYIMTKDMKSLQPEVIDFEDHKALCGGVDGLNVVRSILELGCFVLRKGGNIWLEVDSGHPPVIEHLADQYELRYVATYRDYMGLPRYCLLEKQ